MRGLGSAHALVERHFEGEGSPRRDRRLFNHLRSCDRCRVRYRMEAMLEELGAADLASQRMARGLFSPSVTRRPFLFWATGLAAAVAALLILARPRDEFQARGGPEVTRPSLTIYRVHPGGTPERTGAMIQAGDALAFSYSNPPGSGRSHLMVFAYDQKGRVFWFWPAWQEATTNPGALPIGASGQPVELGERIAQPFEPGPLTVVGLFGDRPFTVREVESALAAGEGGLAALGGEAWMERVEVLP
jgi:hypothetical protein